MALGARHGQAKPGGGGRVHTVKENHIALFLRDGPAFAVEQVIAVKRGGDELILGGIGEEVAGELFGGKLIKGHVRIEGFDHPVAPDVLMRVTVLLETIAVGKPRGIQPGQGHAFAVVG